MATNSNKWQQKLFNESVSYYCKYCDYITDKKYSYKKHTMTAKHQKCEFGNNWQQLATKVSPKIKHTFYCKKCEYKTDKKNSYEKHILTLKHKNANFGGNFSQKSQLLQHNFCCEICEYITDDKNSYDEHNLTLKHKNATFSQKSQLLQHSFCCEICEYITDDKNSYDEHILTLEHKNATFSKSRTEDTENILDTCAKVSHDTQSYYICENCNKKYNDRTGLWRHNKKCDVKKENPQEMIQFLVNQNTEVIKHNTELSKQNTELSKQNTELSKNAHNMMIEVVKSCAQNNMNNSHNTNHSHNKTFNLQFFLNETCKDAMNITDFVNSITLKLSDLEKVGEIGFVEGISNIIVDNLNSLDETKRPVHCTDMKREVMYVKDDDKWEKENENKQKIRKVIKKVAQKNTQLLCDFKTIYPDCATSESKHSDKYSKLIIEAMGGDGDNDAEKENKIIRNIAKGVIIEK
jgi:hypothetical protein